MNNNNNNDKNINGGKNKFSLFGFFRRRPVKPIERKSGASLLQEELVQSPGRTALKNFLEKKMAIAGLTIFILIFAACFGLSIIFPLDLNYQDSTQQHIAPGLNFMSLPNGLKNNVALISAGSSYGIGTDQNGNLYIWGKPTAKLKKLPENTGNIVSLSAGLDHALLLNDKGEVFTWGNDRMMLSPVPMDVRDANIVYIEAGNQASAAIDDKGKIYIWGNTNFISINLNLLAETDHPEKIVLNSSTAYVVTKDKRLVCLTQKDILLAKIPQGIDGRVLDVASNDKSAAALLDDGTVVTWGGSEYGALDVPPDIQGRVTDIAAGRGHFTALLDDGTAASWGMNNYRQSDVPDNISGVSKISVGYFQNYALTEDGKAVTWGLKGYIMGSDHYGRDMFRRILEGGKITLTVGAVAVIISGIIGIIIGGISGFYGGKVDMVLMRLGEIVNSIPFLPLAIILSYTIGNRIPQSMRMVLIMVILGVLSWPGLARLTRAQILVERESEFVTAAKAMGIRERVIIFRHIVPNVMAVVLVSLTLSLASSMLVESTLSFLGFGILEPSPSWGNILTGMSSDVIRNYSWRWVFPSIILGLSTISINLVGNGLHEAIDPKSNDR